MNDSNCSIRYSLIAKRRRRNPGSLAKSGVSLGFLPLRDRCPGLFRPLSHADTVCHTSGLRTLRGTCRTRSSGGTVTQTSLKARAETHFRHSEAREAGGRAGEPLLFVRPRSLRLRDERIRAGSRPCSGENTRHLRLGRRLDRADDPAPQRRPGSAIR